MKLHIDQNLSRKLPAAIADLFPGSVHVRDLQMARSPDTEIWEYAQEYGFVIITKDAWFYQRCLVSGPPPQVIWIRAGNCPAVALKSCCGVMPCGFRNSSRRNRGRTSP